MSVATRSLGLFTIAASLAFAGPAGAQMSSQEKSVLDSLDVARVKDQIRFLSEDVVKTKSGAGAGTAVVGSPEETELAQAVSSEMKKIGLQVHAETYPVRRYTSGPVALTANGAAIQAVSLHAAGGTWGLRDGVPYARGNEDYGHRVRAHLADVGDGYLADFQRAGSVRGKVVLVRRGEVWPVYQILEAAYQGAIALVIYDFPGAADTAIKQDSMWYHEQLPTVSISRHTAQQLLQNLKSGPVEVVLENRIDVADDTSQNIIGTITGSVLPNEWLLVAAHYDRWWQSAVDNCSGVAAVLELARAIKAGNPRRSVMFLASSGEEAGVEATEFDWLAGSHAFVAAHPEIERRLVYAFNIDTAGWTADRGTLFSTPELLSFQQQALADLGLASKVKIHLGLDPDEDGWNFATVGGGGAGWLVWGQFGNDGGQADANPFWQYYHTQLDVYHSGDYQNLSSHLRFGALELLRMDAATNVPLNLEEMASWLQQALDRDEALAPQVSFEGVRTAAKEFHIQAARVESERAKFDSLPQATSTNLLLMRTRKNLLPWLSGFSSTGVRTSPNAIVFAAVRDARVAAERNDRSAVIAALERVDSAMAGWETPSVRAAAAFSPAVARAERIYWYTSGDWSASYEQKPRPLAEELDNVYLRLSKGSSAKAEVATLRQLEAEARAHLTEALFLVCGKLWAATDDLKEPIPGE
jgi:Peptidase family M28/PA domain